MSCVFAPPSAPVSVPRVGRTFRRFVATVTMTAALLAAASPAFAKPACYSQAEFEAEQAIRLHTDLMVIGLTCHKLAGDRNLFGKYQQFTATHKASLMNWEKTLIGYFRSTDKANPTRKFDDFRTVLANQSAQRAALLTPPVFCQTNGDIIESTAGLSDSDLRRFLGQDQGIQLANMPPCDVPGVQTSVVSTPAKAAKPGKSAKPAKAGAKPAKPIKTASSKP
jgi:hypothetical protein